MDSPLEVRGRDHPYVSRGGVKLAGALDAFALDPEGLVAADFGASTGGFTDCLLQRGATRVYAIDVGYGQLADRLRRDPRVVVMERTNARHLKADDLAELVDLVVIDASFISLTKLLPAARALLSDQGEIVAMVKAAIRGRPRSGAEGHRARPGAAGRGDRRGGQERVGARARRDRALRFEPRGPPGKRGGVSSAPQRGLRHNRGVLDRVRYPRLAAYLDGLPEGLDSYPECQSKATLLVSAFDGVDASELLDGLPDRLTSLVREPPAAGIWVPAVWSDAMFHASCDRFFPTVEAVQAWTYERTVRISKHPIYRRLLTVPGPRMLIKIGTKAHGLIQRGTEIETALDRRGAELTMRFPPRLHVGLNLSANVALWRGCVEITGGQNVRCDMVSCSDTEARYRVDFE